MDIGTIDREELREKLERANDFRLVMTLSDWVFWAQHIPGSMHFPSVEAALKAPDKDDEIVVCCWGGLSDWHAAGLPLEGGAA